MKDVKIEKKLEIIQEQTDELVLHLQLRLDFLTSVTWISEIASTNFVNTPQFPRSACPL